MAKILPFQFTKQLVVFPKIGYKNIKSWIASKDQYYNCHWYFHDKKHWQTLFIFLLWLGNAWLFLSIRIYINHHDWCPISSGSRHFPYKKEKVSMKLFKFPNEKMRIQTRDKKYCHSVIYEQYRAYILSDRLCLTNKI